MNKMIKKRKVLSGIGKWLVRDEIILITGPRRVGKTTLLGLIREELIKTGIKENKIFTLSLEDMDILKDLNRSPKELLKYTIDNNGKNYFLIDEIQYLRDVSNFLKYLFDMHRDTIKLIITGSFLFELKKQLKNALVGRKVSFNMTPLTFTEFVDFKDESLLAYLYKTDIPGSIREKFLSLLQEYLVYGGLPEIVLTGDKEMKKTLLKEYVNTYLKRDIRFIGGAQDILRYNDLLTVIANQVSGLLNTSELSNTVGIPRLKTEQYLETLILSGLIYVIPPYFSNVRTQIVKMKKVFLFDTGIRNQLVRNFNETTVRNDYGALFESFFLNELVNAFEKDSICFFRTKAKAEIDFIIKQDKPLPLELKYKRLKKPEGMKHLTYFANENKIEKGYLVNLTLNHAWENGASNLECIDFRKFLVRLYEEK
jgi:predicted AAA+ superfamily ATPase